MGECRACVPIDLICMLNVRQGYCFLLTLAGEVSNSGFFKIKAFINKGNQNQQQIVSTSQLIKHIHALS